MNSSFFKKHLAILIVLLSLAFIQCKVANTTSNDTENKSDIQVRSEKINYTESIVTGTVSILSTNEPATHADVTLTDAKGASVGTLTDTKGNFTFEKVQPGKYTLEIIYYGVARVCKELTLKKETKYVVTATINYRIQIEKPVIYLYPEKTQSIHVDLKYKGQIVHSYPSYTSSGWDITAQPNGTLVDAQGKEYYALFWEGQPDTQLQPKEGFVVSGKETMAFLEEKLDYLGLNRREANEFIMYWLPRLENNAYNLIHFTGKEYEDMAQLNIVPAPETCIRVMMVAQPLNEKIDFPLQDLRPLKKTRKGYTVVEWGGCLLENSGQTALLKK